LEFEDTERKYPVDEQKRTEDVSVVNRFNGIIV
jgi:hypothetical protein